MTLTMKLAAVAAVLLTQHRRATAPTDRADGSHRQQRRSATTGVTPMHRFMLLSALAFGLASAGFLTPTPALAHERREVGNYQFVVGFVNEPAFQGQPNGIDLTITDKAAQQPVQGAEQTLKAAIAFGGGQAKELPLRARFGMPGKYIADVIPTRAGTYIFTFSGDVNGQVVNERFESGPGRFNDVQAPTALQFPVAEPSTVQLQEQVDQAQRQAATANALAIGGLAVGVLSLLLAGYLLLRRRSTTGRAEAPLAQGSRAD